MLDEENIATEIRKRIRRNASSIRNSYVDMISDLANYSLYHIIHTVLSHLDNLDILSCLLVSKYWNHLLNDVLKHSKKFQSGWLTRNPRVETFQCEKKRAVCTVSELAADERSVLIGIGTSGNIELWNRRKPWTRRWIVHEAHDQGVYALDMNDTSCVSGGGEDGMIKIWERDTGALCQSLKPHSYIVWNAIFYKNELLTCSYDSSVAKFVRRGDKKVGYVLSKILKGPFSWGNALVTDHTGNCLITQNDADYSLYVWDLTEDWNNDEEDQDLISLEPRLELIGHEDEVNCMRIKGSLALSGSSDLTVRIWNLETGVCVRVLTGLEGKVWCLDMDEHRVAAGGRFGQIGIWNLKQDNREAVIEGRFLSLHSRSTAVGVIRLEKVGILSGDGGGQVMELNFWNSEQEGEVEVKL